MRPAAKAVRRKDGVRRGDQLRAVKRSVVNKRG